tara:strand:+ start:1742 stop:3013 length:1272 start_codon:yes stop_codon:yes gene_type:complete
MSYPTLTPTSQTSAVVLTSTGSAALVAASCPYGIYTGSVDFLSGASEQVAYTYKKLGGDILDIELTPGNVYAAYEEAVLEYSYIVNIHQSKNVLSNMLGATTGTFDHHGNMKDGALKTSLGDDKVALKFPKFKFTYAERIADALAGRAGLGDNKTEYSASFTTTDNVQDYDLQSIISSSAATDTTQDYYDKVGNKKVRIKKVFYKSSHAMWRFFGYYGGVNTVGNLSNYGMYADDTTFELIPSWHNRLQAMTFEDNIYVRISHYSYEIKNNKIRLFPAPSPTSPSKIYFQFTVEEDPWEEESDRTVGVDGVNNMNTLPFDNLPYANINAIGKQWIRRFALAITKEMLGQVRSKFGSIPIPGDQVQLNGANLIQDGRAEQESLREELKTTLDELTYTALNDKDVQAVETTNKMQERIPLPIIVG